MIVVREPVLHPVAITDLRPTQITVGMREVQEKRGRLRNHPQKTIGKFLGDHMIPVVRRPKDRMYVVDHHHLALALHHEGVRDILVSVVADLHELRPMRSGPCSIIAVGFIPTTPKAGDVRCAKFRSPWLG